MGNRAEIFVFAESGKFLAVRAGFPSQSTSITMALRDLGFRTAEEVDADSLLSAVQKAADSYGTKAIAIEVYRPADEGRPVDPSFREGRLVGVTAVPAGMLDAGVFVDYQHRHPMIPDTPLGRELIARFGERGRVPQGQQKYPHERFLLNVGFVNLATGNAARAEKIVSFYRGIEASEPVELAQHQQAVNQAQWEYNEATRATIAACGYDNPNWAFERGRQADSRYLELLGL